MSNTEDIACIGASDLGDPISSSMDLNEVIMLSGIPDDSIEPFLRPMH